MSANRPPVMYKGRNIGIVILTSLQLLIGAIHIFSGILLLAYENFGALPATAAYDVYTLVFGLLTAVFAVLIWQGKKAGWVATIVLSLFVIAVDSLTLLNLPTVPGIPKEPAAAEIIYSTIVVAYLLQPHVRKKFSI